MKNNKKSNPTNNKIIIMKLEKKEREKKFQKISIENRKLKRGDI